jgi:hypothetical protein
MDLIVECVVFDVKSSALRRSFAEVRVTFVRLRLGQANVRLRDRQRMKVLVYWGAGVARIQELVVFRLSKSLAMSKYRKGETLHED